MRLTKFVYVPADVLMGALSRYLIFASTRADVTLETPENFAGESPLLSADSGAQFAPPFQFGFEVLQDAEVAELTQLMPKPEVVNGIKVFALVGVHDPVEQVVSSIMNPPDVSSGLFSRDVMVYPLPAFVWMANS